MYTQKEVSQEGNSVAEIVAVGMNVTGLKATLAVDAVAVSGVKDNTGLITVIDNTNNNSAVVRVHIVGGTATLAVLFGHTSIGVAKDTTSKINVYYDATEGLSVQNKLAAETEVTVKFG